MSSTHPLKLNLTIDYLCIRLSVTPQDLEFFITNQSAFVYPFTKQKPNSSKVRQLFNTHKKYKLLLRKINKMMQPYQLPQGVLGGVKGKQVADVARAHCGREALLSLDLKNFFPSIKRKQVYNLFRKARCTKEVCEILSDLVTYEGSLPQGFPTSTTIANWIVYDLDVQHIKYCNKNGIARTRWVDDITFSGKYSAIQKAILPLVGAIKFHKFIINNRKTEYSARAEKAPVVGLDVSSKVPRLPSATIMRIKAMIQDCYEFGQDYVRSEYNIEDKKSVKSSLEGCIRYMFRYNPIEAAELSDVFSMIDWKRQYPSS